jgi:DUF2905 family protein
MDSRSVGFLVILLGIAAILVGLLVISGGLAWFGRLPGDIRIESAHTRVYIPLTSMIIVSLVLSALAYLLRRFF